MTHGRAVEYLVDFASGELEQDLAVRVQIHVSGCQDCREWLESYRVVKLAVATRKTSGKPM